MREWKESGDVQRWWYPRSLFPLTPFLFSVNPNSELLRVRGRNNAVTCFFPPSSELCRISRGRTWRWGAGSVSPTSIRACWQASPLRCSWSSVTWPLASDPQCRWCIDTPCWEPVRYFGLSKTTDYGNSSLIKLEACNRAICELEAEHFWKSAGSLFHLRIATGPSLHPQIFPSPSSSKEAIFDQRDG